MAPGTGQCLETFLVVMIGWRGAPGFWSPGMLLTPPRAQQGPMENPPVAPLVLLFPLLSFTQNLRSVFGSKGQALWGGRLLGRGQLWAPSIPRWYLRPGHCVWFPGGYRRTPSRPSVGLSNASHPGNTSFCAPRMHQTGASSCLSPSRRTSDGLLFMRGENQQKLEVMVCLLCGDGQALWCAKCCLFCSEYVPPTPKCTR